MPQSSVAPSKNKTSATTEKGVERTREILTAARQLFAQQGYAGLSMRKVAASVGISLSNVQHYYPSKDLLIEAVLLMTMNSFQEKINLIHQNVEQTGRLERLYSTIDMFLEELSNPVTYGLFFEIWALAARNDFASALMDTMISRERKAIYKLISGLNPDISDAEYQIRASLIVAQIEGLMLFRYHRQTDTREMQAVYAALKKSVLNLASVP